MCFWGQSCAEEYPTPVGRHRDSEGTSGETQLGPRWEPFSGRSSSSTQKIKISYVWGYFLQLLLCSPSPRSQSLPWWQGAHITPSIRVKPHLPCDDALWGKRRKACPDSVCGPKITSFIPARKCCAEAQPCKTLGCGTCSTARVGLWSTFCSMKESFPLVSLLQPCLAPVSAWAQPGGTRERKDTSLQVCGERQNVLRQELCAEGQGGGGDMHPPGLSHSHHRLGQPGTSGCAVPLVPASQSNLCLMAFWQGPGAVSICQWKYSLLCWSEVLIDFYYSAHSHWMTYLTYLNFQL